MSTRAVREDDEGNKSGSSGLGLAAAAAVVGVGLGIGAALYYFFKPDGEAPHGAAGRSDHAGHFESEIGRDVTPYEAKTTADQEELDSINGEIFRERAWTLEQCSICFDMMLQSSRPDDLLMLPCGHKFHFKCVEPWTRVHNTCPNCRKAV